jgi:hypothetical protein
MLASTKMVLVCRMAMFLGACYWCLGGFTPDRVWGEETSAQSPPSTGSSSEGSSAQSSPTTGSSSQESSWLNPLTWKYKPTGEELQRYRRSWNPFSHSPILANSPDVQPKGQWLVQGFLFSAIAHDRFPNRFGTASVNAPTHLRAISPTVFIGYGITDNMEVDFVPSLIWYDSNKPTATTPGNQSSDIGVGDTTIYLKNRVRVQDPDSWHPTVTFFHNVTLPSSQWMGTHPIPGGFSPLGRLPSTKFGGLGLTEGIMFRKNIEPFRFMLSGYYTYTLPGSTGGQNTYNGDIVNTRAIVEWVADDKRGLAFSLEFLSVHGLDYRLDGHDLNISPTSFSLIGVEPSVQYNIFYDNTGALAVAAGAIYTIAGQNAFDAFYPNISMYYYWNSTGKVLMR